jgi:hypothetical protein
MKFTASQGDKMLTASRHPVAHEIIVVTTDAIPESEGNVVARFNETHGILSRTKHSGTKPSMSAIRTAIAQVR